MSRVESITLHHLSPVQALQAVDAAVGRTENIHEEFHDLGSFQSGLLIYEQGFARTFSRVTLIVAADNFTGETRVRVISAGGGSRLGIDWGAAGAYVNEVLSLLSRADRAGG